MLEPPKSLVCLSSIPKEKWKGLRVYHPFSQVGMTPHWRECDDPLNDQDPSKDFLYDVGEIEEYTPPTEEERDHYPYYQVRFKVSEYEDEQFGRITIEALSYNLVYPEYNLWVEPI